MINLKNKQKNSKISLNINEKTNKTFIKNKRNAAKQLRQKMS